MQPAASSYTTYQNAHESSVYVVVPLVSLSLLAIGLGYVSSDLYRGIGTDFIATVSPINAILVSSVDAEFGVPTILKLMPFIATILGSVMSYIIYIDSQAYLAHLMDNPIVRAIYRFLSYQWNWDTLIIRIVIEPSLRLGHSLSKTVDRGILEAVGPYGMRQAIIITGQQAAFYNTERLTDYAMYIVLAMVTFVVITATVFTESGLSLGLGIAPDWLVMLLGVNAVSLVMASD